MILLYQISQLDIHYLICLRYILTCFLKCVLQVEVVKVKGGNSSLTQPAREKVKVNSERAEDMKVDCELPEQAAGDSKQAG